MTLSPLEKLLQKGAGLAGVVGLFLGPPGQQGAVLGAVMTEPEPWLTVLLLVQQRLHECEQKRRKPISNETTRTRMEGKVGGENLQRLLLPAELIRAQISC